jgi:hypothetical protein
MPSIGTPMLLCWRISLVFLLILARLGWSLCCVGSWEKTTCQLSIRLPSLP